MVQAHSLPTQAALHLPITFSLPFPVSVTQGHETASHYIIVPNTTTLKLLTAHFNRARCPAELSRAGAPTPL
jgi:hypothetical protein